MPAQSQAQRKAAGAALAAERGQANSQELKGASRPMAKSVPEKPLHGMASAQLKGRPLQDTNR